MSSNLSRALTATIAGAALLLLPACAASPATPSASSSAPSSAAPTTAAPNPTAAGFCADVKSFSVAQGAALDDALQTRTAPAAAAALREEILKINSSVPAELRNDWETLRPVIEAVANQAEKPSPTFDATFTDLQRNQAVVAASIRIFDYTKRTCGIDISDLLGTK